MDRDDGEDLRVMESESDSATGSDNSTSTTSEHLRRPEATIVLPDHDGDCTASNLLCGYCRDAIAAAYCERLQLVSGWFLSLPPRSYEAFQHAAEMGCIVCTEKLRLPPWSDDTKHYVVVWEWFMSWGLKSDGEHRRVNTVALRLLDIGESQNSKYTSRSSLKHSWTGHNDVMDLAQNWLQDCLQYHKSCGKKRDAKWYPSRLLQISNTCITLLDTSSTKPSGPYATLSHCWGEKEFLRLIPQTKPLFEKGICLSELPQTFQDCCTALRAMGIAYVWIDCFCIIQGQSPESQQDWASESSKMEFVYANSILNIGASHAQEPSLGCFRTRSSTFQESAFKECRYLPLEIHCDEDAAPRRCILQRYSSNEIRHQWTRFNGLHLFKRGWVMQERLLCPRMLHFGEEQIYWQCGELTLASEEDPYGICRESIHLDGLNLQWPDVPKFGLHFIWSKIVTAYTSSVLSYPEKDRLRAIEGVGKRLARLMDDELCEGLLLGNMPASLAWEGNTLFTSRFTPDPMRAPTWSWASLKGAIWPFACHRSESDQAVFVCKGSILVPSTRGAYATTALYLLARLVPITRQWDDARSGEAQHRASPHVVNGREEAAAGPTINVTYDDATEEEEAASLPKWLFWIGRRKWGIHQGLIAGLVVCRNRDGTYRRVGVVINFFTNDAGLRKSAARFIETCQQTPATMVVLV